MRLTMSGFALILCATPALAQTGTPQPVLPGYLSTAACASSNLSPCYLSTLNGANLVRGMGSNTTTSATTIIAAQSTGVKTYITGLQCYRSDSATTSVIVSFDDTASTTIVLPNAGGGGGSNMVFNTPLVTAAATAFTFQAATSISSIICNAQGYIGS